MDQDSDIHLRWNHHQTMLLSVFSSLLSNENLADCTISTEGQHFKAHRVILSACSPYFESLFNEHCETHPIIILPDVKFYILKALMKFVYSGEVKVPQDKLCTVLDLADTLQIKGLRSVGDSEIEGDLRSKRRSQSPIHCDQQRFKKLLREHKYGSQMKQKEAVSSLHISENVFSEDTDSFMLTAQKCDKNSSTSVSYEKTVEEPATSQDITNPGAFNAFRCSSPTNTMNKSSTCVSGALLNSVSNTLDFSQLPGCSKERIGEQSLLSEKVLLLCSSTEEMRMSEPLGMNGNKPAVGLLPEINQEDPVDCRGNSIEEIILDDDTDENDDHNHGGDVDNSSSFGRRVIPDESFSSQGFSSVEQYRDTYCVEPTSVPPNQFKCDACGRSYRHRFILNRHRRYECGKEPQFGCPHCPYRCFHKHDLKKHISSRHSPHKV